MAGGIQVWSDGKGHAKANQTPGSPCPSGELLLCGALDGPGPTEELFVSMNYGFSNIVMIMALFILGAFSFISSLGGNALIRPSWQTGRNREHWTGRLGAKI